MRLEYIVERVLFRILLHRAILYDSCQCNCLLKRIERETTPVLCSMYSNSVLFVDVKQDYSVEEYSEEYSLNQRYTQVSVGNFDKQATYYQHYRLQQQLDNINICLIRRNRNCGYSKSKLIFFCPKLSFCVQSPQGRL